MILDILSVSIVKSANPVVIFVKLFSFETNIK